MDRLYTAKARAYGARTGAVVSSDDRLDLQLSRPSEMGGDGGPGTNPEQLFAAGYAACFHSAMRFAVKDVGLCPRALEGSHVTARVHFFKEPPMNFGLAVELEFTAP
jgi:lipoyl-dependent peroxiredoxin